MKSRQGRRAVPQSQRAEISDAARLLAAGEAHASPHLEEVEARHVAPAQSQAGLRHVTTDARVRRYLVGPPAGGAAVIR